MRCPNCNGKLRIRFARQANTWDIECPNPDICDFSLFRLLEELEEKHGVFLREIMREAGQKALDEIEG